MSLWYLNILFEFQIILLPYIIIDISLLAKLNLIPNVIQNKKKQRNNGAMNNIKKIMTTKLCQWSWRHDDDCWCVCVLIQLVYAIAKIRHGFCFCCYCCFWLVTTTTCSLLFCQSSVNYHHKKYPFSSIRFFSYFWKCCGGNNTNIFI